MIHTLVEGALFVLIAAVLVRPVGGYLTRVFSGQRTLLDPLLCPLERGIYRLVRVDLPRGGVGASRRTPHDDHGPVLQRGKC